MTNIIEHKGFIGSVRFSPKDKVFYGKIEGIDDLISFEGTSVDELVSSFHEAVEDYLQLCKEVDKEPLKSFKGSFNIRMTPELHRKSFQAALSLGISLNKFIQKSVEKEIHSLSL